MRRYAIAAALFLLVSAPARAEQITLGSLTAGPNYEAADIFLSGSGFLFVGSANPLCGVFAPLLANYLPGNDVDLTARWTGTDLPGYAEHGGQTFSEVGNAMTNTALDAMWSGLMTLPDGFGGGIVTAPFAFLGMFSVDGVGIELRGSGIAAAEFVNRGDGSMWLASLRYEFAQPVEALAAADITPVPEPATLGLLALGLLGIGYNRLGWSR